MSEARPEVSRAVSGAVGVGASVLAVTLALACGGERSPSTPTPTAVPTAPPVTTPPPTLVASCPFGRGSREVECSARTRTALLPEVETAIELIPQRRPGILDLSDENPRGSGQYRIVDRSGFIDAVLESLRAAGLCAEADYDFPLEAISVKSSNDFSEDFVLVRWGAWARRGPSLYQHSCSPAAFPVDPLPTWPPAGSGCGEPYPEPIHHFNAKVHMRGRDYATLDSTPIVGPDGHYCATIGYTDGRTYCPVRAEGSRDREACEGWRVGKAQDTGRDGPTWRYGRGDDAEYCRGLDVNGCANHPENQYQLLAARGGTYLVCAQNGACGEVYLDR